MAKPEWERRLEAVAVLGIPPVPKDGEVECLNPTCKNRRLNRGDLTCWLCGGDRFAPASAEMNAALRFNYVPPPRLDPPKPAEPPAPAFKSIVFSAGAMPAGWFFSSPVAPPAGPDPGTIQAIADAIKEALKPIVGEIVTAKADSKTGRQQAAHLKRMDDTQGFDELMGKVYGKRRRSAPFPGNRRGWKR